MSDPYVLIPEDSSLGSYLLAVFPNTYSSPTDRMEAIYFARWGLAIT